MSKVQEGCVLGGRYRLSAKLGEGSMGSVWRAEHLALAAPVAVKVLDESIARHPVALARFMREAQAAAGLRSLHVVQIHDFGVDQGVPYIAMELLDGEPLGERLDRAGKLSPADTAIVISHVARGIGKAHEAGVIHRDLKPDNVFIVREDDEEYAKVVDFGVAKAGEGVFAATLTSAGRLLGTPGYMSAEQAAGEPVDHRTDIWSMAVIAFECLTGTLPFVGDNLPDLLFAIHDGPIPVPSRMGVVPLGFDEWFTRGVARNRKQRFQSSKEAAAELRKLCGLEAGPARTIGGRVWTGSHSGSLAPRAPGREELAAAPTERITPAGRIDLDPIAETPAPEAARVPVVASEGNPGAEETAAISEPPASFDDIIRAEDILKTGQRPVPQCTGRGVFALRSGGGFDGELDESDVTGDRTDPRLKTEASAAAEPAEPAFGGRSPAAPDSASPPALASAVSGAEQSAAPSQAHPPASRPGAPRAEMELRASVSSTRTPPIVVEVVRPRANSSHGFSSGRPGARTLLVAAAIIVLLGWAYAIFFVSGVPSTGAASRDTTDDRVPAAREAAEPMPASSTLPASAARRSGD